MNSFLQKQRQIHVLLFFLILFVAIFFRFYKLSSVPPSPSLDEVSIGYNAYSILHTGKDEYGYQLPLLLRAYDDWRPALYVYFVIPFVQLFGLTFWAVRLPSVLLSLATVIATYFLAKEIFQKYKQKSSIGLLAMFLLTISPWHIYISRLGHEVNAGVSVLVFAALFFMIALHHQSKKWMIFVSSFLFSLSFYTYQSEKVFTPLIVITFVFLFWKQLWQMKKYLIISCAIFIIVTIPIFKASISPEGLTRLQGTSAFSNLENISAENAKQVLLAKQHHNVFGEFINNRRLIPVKIFFSNYISHFNPFWLYSNGGADSFKAPGLGLFYWFELPLVLIGIVFLAKSSFEKKTKLVLFFWIIISFIAPSITTQSPHAMRSFNVLPIPQIIEACGLVVLFLILKNRVIKIVVFLFFFFFIITGITQFYHQYFYVFPKEQSQSFQYALSSALSYEKKVGNSYDHIVVSNTDNLYQSYMFYLFINIYDPQKYLNNKGTPSGGFAQIHTINTVTFRPILWNKEKKDPHTLYIGNPNDFPGNTSILQKFYYLDGKEGVWIVKT
jgi:4-amino-4-deoxy-L-arabinose transferase-like glycosyltransferase